MKAISIRDDRERCPNNAMGIAVDALIDLSIRIEHFNVRKIFEITTFHTTKR